jgi:NAD(P)-dependent dehydrogenase (short-subunit alcohol dehydrogenase family)
MPAKRESSARSKSGRVEEQYRGIQREIDAKDARKPKKKKESDKPVQTSRRRYPADLPAQHLEKPGLEADLELAPRYEAPDYKGSEKLLDMVAIITGGDSGIGRAVAVLYAREGADVALVYLPEEQVDADETREAVEKEGRRCLLIPGDVSDYAFCEQAVARTVRAFGRLDILVNNAAFQEHADSLEDISLEHFDRTMKTNLYGYFYMARAALPQLKRGSSIINTSSVTALEGSAKLLDYSTTKGGINAFTKALSQNVLEKGIRVNAVAPGPVWTPLNPAETPAEEVAEFGKDTSYKRAAQPEELSPLYVFLAAPSCSSYITGEVIPVVGGQG